ncbi:uncharacterized protein LODBEIA_P51120 [Lodderomyces beijingensis]|uniref:MaoC-like domain-containing protein n=1 Tax=Lodderomyces beijingensis TaxID=1775926 RepID=A0ABP0ZRW1_9ASCO
MTNITREIINTWANSIKSRTFRFNDTYSLGPATHLQEILRGIFARQGQERKMVPSNSWLWGSHFLFNNQSNLVTGSDGYDNYQAPVIDGHQLYLRRLWAKGSIRFFDVPELNSSLHCDEHVSSVRFINENVLVNIERNFHTHLAPLLQENRTLIYTNALHSPPPAATTTTDSSISKTININRDDGLAGACLSLTPVDLLKYSMLTYNLHKIHIDTKYCHSVENLPTLVVHGPLQVTLLLYHFAIQHPELKPTQFKYRTYQVCFVNDKLSICVTPSDGIYDLCLFNAHDGRVYMQGQLTCQ